MTIRNEQALQAARQHEPDIVSFLRDLIATPAESRKERERCERVHAEYERLGFDEVFFDKLGTVVARIGNGPLKILMDGHIDCVGIGDPAAWAHDPFEGKLEDGKIWGRGAVDELPAIACMAMIAVCARLVPIVRYDAFQLFHPDGLPNHPALIAVHGRHHQVDREEVRGTPGHR